MYQYLFLYMSGMGNNKTLITETTKVLFLSQVFIIHTGWYFVHSGTQRAATSRIIMVVAEGKKLYLKYM